MHLLQAFSPLDATKLSGEEKSKAISSLMFITEKRDGTIKARACAVGQKQREFMSKDDVAMPTVMLESIFITAVLEAKEERDAAVVDPPGAFLHTDNENDVMMTMTGKLAELMVMIAPQLYCKCVTTNKQGETHV